MLTYLVETKKERRVTIASLRAEMYEHRVMVDAKKRKWRNDHACSLCHRGQVVKEKLCLECLRHEAKSNFRMPEWLNDV